MARVAIGLGSNLGDRLANLQAALDALERAITWESVSGVYETAPMYVVDQPAYFNAAALGETEHGPLALLNELKRVEAAIGRQERTRYGPREIDLDLLAYGALKLEASRRDGSRLLVPHPRTPERRFVLQPLCDLDPDLNLPGLGNVLQLREGTNAQSDEVRALPDAVLSVHRNRRSG